MSFSRRRFLIGVPLALVPCLAIPGGPQSPGGLESEASNAMRAAPVAPGASVASRAAAAPVVSFHLDQPYLDLTGLEKPYVPPAGMRSGAPLAALSEEEVLSRFYGVI